VDADWAQEHGDLVTLDEIMAIAGLTETPEQAWNSSLCVEGDMCAEDINGFNLLQERAAQGFRSAINTFPSDEPIKTCVYPGTTESAANAFRLAQEQFTKHVPCPALEFEQVEFGSGCNVVVSSLKPGCSAVIGKISETRPTNINLGAGCTSIGIATHELGHALGMMHEHARADRDEYVEIHWDNIQSGKAGNFFKSSGGDDDLVPYDLGSLMHYSATDFSNGTKEMFEDGTADTISIRAGVVTKVMGNRLGLTGFDAKQLGFMYGCATDIDWKLCPRAKDGNGCSTEPCVCLQDTDGVFPVIKATVDGCHRCVRICSDDGSSDCGCPAECRAEEVVVADEANKMRCVMPDTGLGCLAHGPNAPAVSTKRRRRRRRKGTGTATTDSDSDSDTTAAAVSTKRRRRRRRKGKATLLSLHSKQCIDLVEDSVCSKHSRLYCEYDGQVSVTVRNKGITLAFATEACAKTCNKC